MAKFVPDVKTQRWIVIAPARVDRPAEFKEKITSCPFCEGNEGETPLELYRMGGEGLWNKSGWQVRVVPNKFPITDTHEVIIHSPDHLKDIEDFDLPQVVRILTVYRTRFLTHMENGQVIIFSNHGEHAGASLAHPHTQLVVIPKQRNLDALVKEPIMNIIEDNTFFVTYCPDFSQWPYEIWIAPKRENTMFSDVNDEEIQDLAAVLQRAIKKLSIRYKKLEEQKKHSSTSPFAYNFYIHHGKNWFIRIIPRLVHRAGFELGTGLSVNVVDPTNAAKELKEVQI